MVRAGSEEAPHSLLTAASRVPDVPYEVHQWAVHNEQWQMQPADSPPTPWIPIDPTEPATSERNRRYPRFASALAPLVVEVHQGETLYLPAG